MVHLSGGQTPQDIGQVLFRIDTTAPATDQDRVNNRAAPAGIGVANEEPALAADGSRAYRVFHQVIVDFEASVAQITRQRIVIVEEVIDGLPECAFRQ